MQRIAFKMKLFKGFEEEYKRRHATIWPDLQSLLKLNGIMDYSIFLEETTGDLFAVLKVHDKLKLDELPLDPVMQKWWDYMKDIMETNEDHSPATSSLNEVFHLE